MTNELREMSEIYFAAKRMGFSATAQAMREVLAKEGLTDLPSSFTGCVHDTNGVMALQTETTS